ncbi:MAG TPA: TolC family protein [Pseudobdellovibrionaceae bacterium]
MKKRLSLMSWSVSRPVSWPVSWPASFSLIFALSMEAHAIEGFFSLEQQLNEQNQTLSALKKELQSKESLLQSSYSPLYPSLSAVAGWGQNRMDNPEESNQGYFGYLEGRLNLFNGLKDIAISDQKEIEVQLKKLEYENSRLEIRLALAETMGNMIYLHKLQTILNDEARITKDQKMMAAKKVSSGLTSSVDNLELDLREKEIEIQQKQIDQLHRESHAKLFELFGQDIPDTELDKMTFDSIEKLRYVKSFNEQNNIEVQRAQLVLILSHLEQKELRADFMPSVDFVYSFGRLTPSETSPVKMNESKYGIQVSIPLFSGFSTIHKNTAGKYETLAKKSRATQAVLSSQSSFNSLKEKLQELSDLYEINEAKLVTSKKYFEMTVSEYKRGIKNSPDLVGATERWFNSQKKKLELLKELELTKTRIENLNGNS